MRHIIKFTSRLKECRISSGESELFPIHSFGTEPCLDDRLEVEILELSEKIRFRYRTFRFQHVKTIDQRHQIRCTLGLDDTQTISKNDIKECKCYDLETCDSASWSYWSKCDGNCKQTRIRNANDPAQATENRDCPQLCFFDVDNEIDDSLKTCSIHNNRSKRDQNSRLLGGSSAYQGSLPYVVRLSFQNFDQFHSDTQLWFHTFFASSG